MCELVVRVLKKKTAGEMNFDVNRFDLDYELALHTV